MSRALYIAAKAPRPGFVKTRLARRIGHDHAVGLYQAFVRDLARRFATAAVAPSWFVTPDDAWASLEPLAGPVRPPARVLAQGEGSWTQRQRRLFRGAPDRGEEQVVLVASDSPQLTVGAVAEAFTRLQHDDVVLGPVHDGGYYLLGMRGWHDVLAGVEMSTTAVVEQIESRAHELGLSLGLLPATFDVDEVDDLAPLRAVAAARADLPSTAAALSRLASAGPAPIAHARGPAGDAGA